MKVLCVAAAGGHLLELHRLLPRLSDEPIDPVWVTFDTAQSRSLLAAEETHYVRYPATHDPFTTIRNLRQAWHVLRHHRFDAVISTGSSIAVSFLPLARARRIPTHYIESATRIDSPSLTGRILQRVPGVKLYSQHPSWADDRWVYRGSVFDGYVAHDRSACPADVARIVVSVGSARDYGFRRLIERLVAVIPGEVDVLWQTGATDTTGLDIEARPSVPFDELAAANAAADVVVIHAGIGSSMTALEAGRFPVVCPRRAAFGEHVDDHQVENAELLATHGLGLAREAGEVSWDDLGRAATKHVVIDGEPPRFVLS